MRDKKKEKKRRTISGFEGKSYEIGGGRDRHSKSGQNAPKSAMKLRRDMERVTIAPDRERERERSQVARGSKWRRVRSWTKDSGLTVARPSVDGDCVLWMIKGEDDVV
jgi:hypothetical protein